MTPKSCARTVATIAIALSFTIAARAADVPRFEVDASWPKPLPNNWILGQVGGITTDSQGHIWVLHRPKSLTEDENGAGLKPPRSKCCVSAPPVLEFDVDGNLLRSWADSLQKNLVTAIHGSGVSTASKSTRRASFGSAATPTTTTRS